jgi:hypothetical protein
MCVVTEADAFAIREVLRFSKLLQVPPFMPLV